MSSSRLPAAIVAHRFTFLSLLRASLVIGAIYDLGFAALIAFAPELPQRWFGLPLPGETFYLWLIAVFLTMLAAFYLVAAQDPRRYSANVAIAIVGRSLGFVVLAAAAASKPELAGLWGAALGDLAFALLHLAFWIPFRRA